MFPAGIAIEHCNGISLLPVLVLAWGLLGYPDLEVSPFSAQDFSSFEMIFDMSKMSETFRNFVVDPAVHAVRIGQCWALHFLQHRWGQLRVSGAAVCCRSLAPCFVAMVKGFVHFLSPAQPTRIIEVARAWTWRSSVGARTFCSKSSSFLGHNIRLSLRV